MNSPSSALNEPEIKPQESASTAAIRPFYWSVRRELWESRSVYIAPLAVAAIFLFGFLISLIHFSEKILGAMALDPVRQHQLLEQPYNFAALLIMGSGFIVGVFYCLDALHGERRDRSILFWKSLPVSDLTTVLAKASIPVVILPLLCFLITVTTHLVMLLLSTVALSGNDQSVATLWTNIPWINMSLVLLYHLVTVHALGYAPIYAWLLLVSGWARRAVFLWAALPVFAIAAVEKIAFNTTHFLDMLGNVIQGMAQAGGLPARISFTVPLSHLAPWKFISSPALWVELAVTAIFLAAAARLRRYKGPI